MSTWMLVAGYTLIGFIVSSIDTVLLKAIVEKDLGKYHSKDIPFGILFIIIWLMWPFMLIYQLIYILGFVFNGYITWVYNKFKKETKC